MVLKELDSVLKYHILEPTRRVAQLAEHWANPTVARHIFQACPVWIYNQSSNRYLCWHTIISVKVNVMKISDFVLHSCK